MEKKSKTFKINLFIIIFISKKTIVDCRTDKNIKKESLLLSKEQLLRSNLWQTKSKRFRINFIDDLSLLHNFRILIKRFKNFV